MDAQGALDALPFAGEELACPFSFHAVSLHRLLDATGAA